MLGLTTAICGAVGVPPINGVLPQAPMHTRACAHIAKQGGADADGKPSFHIREQRWTNLIQSLLCGGCIFITPVLRMIPRSVLWGFFIYMASKPQMMTSLPLFKMVPKTSQFEDVFLRAQHRGCWVQYTSRIHRIYNKLM